MCGIAGLLGPPDQGTDRLTAVIQTMTDTVRHRGPDDAGSWVDQRAGVALGHRRLSILDLSPLGHQPMISSSGRWIVSLNGEIYNFAELRQRLERAGRTFRGRSDTEVLVEAVDAWGVEATLARLNAMFAMALWDRARGELHLIRDRLGEKPLYYAWAGRTFLFASELKAIAAHPEFVARVDRGALALYLRHNCVPAPYAIYQDTGKLLPGHRVTMRVGDVGRRDVHQEVWWSAARVAEAEDCGGPATPEEAIEELGGLLADSVRLRTTADVPVGALLSGGVDSSLIAALMQADSKQVKTFTVGFDSAAYDESVDAARVGRHLNTDHTELRVGPREAQAVVPRLADLYDEPFADSSQIPTVLVAELARRHVTVVLSGDGGDELFAGYNRHQWCERVARRMQAVPLPLRRMAAAGLSAPSPAAIDRSFRTLGRVLPAAGQLRNPSTKVTKLAEVVALPTPEDMYRRLVSHWVNPEALVPGAAEPPTVGSSRDTWPRLSGAVQRMLYLDLVTYLPDDILTKVDRATMSVGLEARIPLLDHRVVELAWRLPLSLKLGAGQTKWILRALVDRHVPRSLIERPKMGFGIPLAQWLRGDLRPWAEDLLDPTRLNAQGYLTVDTVRQTWRAHLAGKVDASYALWDVLMFQAWLDRWVP